MAQTTFSGPVKSDNGFLAPSYTVAQTASLTATAGKIIYVSNAAGASLTGSICYGNGSVWIDVTTGAAVTA